MAKSNQGSMKFTTELKLPEVAAQAVTTPEAPAESTPGATAQAVDPKTGEAKEEKKVPQQKAEVKGPTPEEVAKIRAEQLHKKNASTSVGTRTFFRG